MNHDNDIVGGLHGIDPGNASRVEIARGTDLRAGINEGRSPEKTLENGEPRLLFAGTASRLLVPTSDGSIYLPCEGIIRLQADGSYTLIHTENGERHLTCKGVGVLHEKLPATRFFRCHHAHVINLLKVRKLLNHGGHRAELFNGDRVEVSRRKWKELRVAMNSLGI